MTMPPITVDRVTTAAQSVINRMPNRFNETNKYVNPNQPDQKCLIGEVLSSLALPLPAPNDQLNEASVLQLADWYSQLGIEIEPEATQLLRQLQIIADRQMDWAEAREAISVLA